MLVEHKTVPKGSTNYVIQAHEAQRQMYKWFRGGEEMRRAEKAIRFGLMYGMDFGRIEANFTAKMADYVAKATAFEKAQTKRRKANMKITGRVQLQATDVEHLTLDPFVTDGTTRCLICGKQAHHRVRGKLDLCNHHFARMFRLPPNRHPKKLRPKKVVKLGEYDSRNYRICRHRSTPLEFYGNKVVCHDGGNVFHEPKVREDVPPVYKVFFTLYHALSESTPETDYYCLTATIVNPKTKRAVPFVSMMSNLEIELDDQLLASLKFFERHFIDFPFHSTKFDLEANHFADLVRRSI